MSIEIPGFSELEGQLKQRLAEEQAIKDQLLGARRVALGVWEQMEKARQFALEDVLREKDLGLCSWGSWGHDEEETEQERLGIFPRSNLRSLYLQRLNSDLDSDNEPGLYNFCPPHYQRDLDMHRDNSQDLKSRWFLSEVENREGRLVTVVDSIDVTDMPIRYKVEDRDMEKIFQHFDLPLLPPRPVFQS